MIEAPKPNYALADEYADFVHAIFIVESSENPLAVGDEWRALGLGQHHPAFFIDNYHAGSGRFTAAQSDTWIEAWIKATANFLSVWEHLGLDQAVQAYNLGPGAVLKGGRNPDYLQKFDAALKRVKGMKSNAQ